MTEMTSGIGDLLQRLRRDGVEAGESEKQKILQDAETKAKSLIADAEARAKEIVANAQADVEAKRKQLNAELSMAARDFAFRFAERIQKQSIEPLIGERVTSALGQANILRDALTALLKERASGSITISPETRSSLEGYFQQELGQLMASGQLQVHSEDGLTGFRLQRSGESYCWDVTGEAVAKELCALVEPSLRKYLQITPSKG